MPEPTTAALTDDFFKLLREERKDSAKERATQMEHFMAALKEQTDSNTAAMGTLGDRVEGALTEVRTDVRTMFTKLIWTVTLAFLVLAALAGVGVMWDGSSVTLNPAGESPAAEAAGS